MDTWGLDMSEDLVVVEARKLANVSLTTGSDGPAPKAIAYDPNSVEWTRTIFRGIFVVISIFLLKPVFKRAEYKSFLFLIFRRCGPPKITQ